MLLPNVCTVNADTCTHTQLIVNTLKIRFVFLQNDLTPKLQDRDREIEKARDKKRAT